MAFNLQWTDAATAHYQKLEVQAKKTLETRKAKGKSKSSKAEGLFKQIVKTLRLLQDNPKHPGLKTHEYHGLSHPHDPKEKVWEAYAQNNAPSAYRVFWCYGPQRGELTIIAITPHP